MRGWDPVIWRAPRWRRRRARPARGGRGPRALPPAGKAGAVDESALVAVRVLDGDDEAVAVGAHDQRTRSAREARRAGEAGESHEVATVTLRGSIDQGRGDARARRDGAPGRPR